MPADITTFLSSITDFVDFAFDNVQSLITFIATSNPLLIGVLCLTLSGFVVGILSRILKTRA